jgi:peptide/nickel transport system permease protein
MNLRYFGWGTSESGGTRDAAGAAWKEATWMRIARDFGRQPLAMAALAVLLIAVVIAVLAPLLPLPSPTAQSLRHRFHAFSWAFPLGTDDLGRDQLSRIIFGTRTSLLAATQATSVAILIGVPLGMCAGYFGRWIDAILGRVADAFQSVPPLILAFAVIAAMGRSLSSAMFAIGVVFAPRIFRVVRGATISVSRSAYIEAARTFGASNFHIVGRHVLPNILSPLIVQASVAMSFGMLAEAALSFLGLGVQPPAPSLGNILTTAAHFMFEFPYLMFVPGLLIAALALSFSIFADGLRDAMGRAQ